MQGTGMGIATLRQAEETMLQRTHGLHRGKNVPKRNVLRKLSQLHPTTWSAHRTDQADVGQTLQDLRKVGCRNAEFASEISHPPCCSLRFHSQQEGGLQC